MAMAGAPEIATEIASESSPSYHTTEATTKSTLAPKIAPPVEAADPDATLGIRRKPFVHPVKDTVIPPPPELSNEQQTAYNSVLNTVTAWTHVPVSSTAKNPEQAPISEDEQQWLTRECLLRYLRATKWDVGQAVTRLQETLTWRREYGVHSGKLTAQYISVENETGKQWLVGYDKSGRPCHYLNPARQNTMRSDRQIEHLVFMLERAIDVMPAGQETLALLINFSETSSGQKPSVGQGRQVLNILQSHYPERLGRALLIHLPWFFWAFMKVITPFIDPLTRTKLVFNEDLKKHIPASQLLKSHGGEVEFEYDHSVYWPSLNALADERRAAMNERWIQGGKQVGELENYLRGGQDQSLKDIVAEQRGREKAMRPPMMDRSATSRSGGLRVARTDADEQRRHKSVSIYEGTEGHEDAASLDRPPVPSPLQVAFVDAKDKALADISKAEVGEIESSGTLKWPLVPESNG